MNLTIDQMRAIVDGAPEGAEFYSKQSYWKTEAGESFIGNRFDGWRRTHWDVSTVRHWNMTKLTALRTAIAEHDAETATVAEVPVQDITDSQQLDAFLDQCRWMVIDGTRDERGWFTDLRTQMCWHFWTKALQLKDHGHD